MAPSLNTLESQEGNPRAGDRGRPNYAERRKKIISHDNPNANTPTMMAARAMPLPVSPTAVFRNRYDDRTPPTMPMSAGSELMGPAKGKVERPTTENRSEKSARGLVRGTGMPSCAVLCRLVPSCAVLSLTSNVLEPMGPGVRGQVSVRAGGHQSPRPSERIFSS